VKHPSVKVNVGETDHRAEAKPAGNFRVVVRPASSSTTADSCSWKKSVPTLVHSLVQRPEQAGLTDVTLVVYPEARHEVFTETNRDQVVADLTWLDRLVPRPS
jgi:hypothetical protein